MNAAGVEPTISRSQGKLLILYRRRAPYHWAMRPLRNVTDIRMWFPRDSPEAVDESGCSDMQLSMV
ncbi:hypothetical protein PGTUg99_024204 [Puccinia graminis f. sp. tritici]|uniref:Uncharacterized protein n=1 Tax=Puccinia graminis f. sp. tritici TaxID=56615 RepID=A0A5B0N0W9_PUCGR|nr:hypothetical protein PGTUg99_024204 [Puccinia graminis f. sp. tritici]